MEMVDKFLTKMYRTNPDFVFTVTRDFVRRCQTPVPILPDDIPAHPYAVAMEAAMLAPNAEVSMFPWKEPRNGFPWRCARYVPFSERIGPRLPRLLPHHSLSGPSLEQHMIGFFVTIAAINLFAGFLLWCLNACLTRSEID
jgi:hypothetical protein